MSEQTGASVECPICGEEFDPTAAGGWCTNPDCGEWQYDGGDPFPDSWSAPDVDASESDGVEAETRGAGAHERDGDEDRDDPGNQGTDRGNGEIPETAEVEGSAGGDDGPQTGREESSDETREESPDEIREESPDDVRAESSGDVREDTAEITDDVEADSAAEVHTDSPDDVSVDCPECGETVGPDTNFCSSCGTEVTGSEPATEQSLASELSACPECGEEVGPGDNFCAVCGHNLEIAREGETLTECPECGEEVGPGDSFCASCGENLESRGSDAADGGADPGTLLLAARGEEIAVTDGDSVGRELRRIIMETGGDEDQAVRVHREHVRFLREDGQFYMIDLGTNPTRLNGQPLQKGDREPVSPGDEIELSGVIGLVIREP